MGFDFDGELIDIQPEKGIFDKLVDDRKVSVDFVMFENMVKVIETFDAEDESSAAQQKQGWKSILDNFKKYVESKGSKQGACLSLSLPVIDDTEAS